MVLDFLNINKSYINNDKAAFITFTIMVVINIIKISSSLLLLFILFGSYLQIS